MSDEMIIKQKLLFDGDGTGDDKKLSLLIKQITKWTLSDSDLDTMRNRILALLSALMGQRYKSTMVKQCNANQRDMFADLYLDFQERVEQIKNDIVKQHDLLARAKIVMQNSIEYDLLVKTVKQEPSRCYMSKIIAEEKNNISQLENEKLRLADMLRAREKQCCVLISSANVLKDIIEEQLGLTDFSMDTS